jgi:hypothetical protein
MARGRRDPARIAGALERGARTFGVVAMVCGGGCIAAAAYLLFATELGSVWMLSCLATLGLLSVLAGYQKLRTGHRPDEE